MALPWVRLDTSMFDHPKFLILFAQKQHRAALVHVQAMAFCGKHETGGFLQKEVVGALQARSADVTALVDVGLWDMVPGGWQLHDWDEYQLSGDEIEKRRQKARDAAAARWRKEGAQ